MVTPELRMRCQRCGEQMEMKEPERGGPWRPDQFWVCAKCGRHFWTTYPKPPAPVEAAPPVPPAPDAPQGAGNARPAEGPAK